MRMLSAALVVPADMAEMDVARTVRWYLVVPQVDFPMVVAVAAVVVRVLMV